MEVFFRALSCFKFLKITSITALQQSTPGAFAKISFDTLKNIDDIFRTEQPNRSKIKLSKKILSLALSRGQKK